MRPLESSPVDKRGPLPVLHSLSHLSFACSLAGSFSQSSLFRLTFLFLSPLPYKKFFSFYSAFHPCINYEHFPFLYTNSQFRDFSANRSYSRNFYRAITKYLYTIHNIAKSGLFISIISVKNLMFIRRHSDPYRMQNGIVSNSDIKCIYIFWKIIAIKKNTLIAYTFVSTYIITTG